MGILDRVGFGRDPSNRVKAAVSYSITPEGREAAESFQLSDKLHERILSILIMKNGYCTMSDLEQQLGGMAAKDINEEMNNLIRMHYVTKRGVGDSHSFGGGGMPFPRAR